MGDGCKLKIWQMYKKYSAKAALSHHYVKLIINNKGPAVCHRENLKLRHRLNLKKERKNFFLKVLTI